MKINCNFDGGNIEIVSMETPNNIQLKIRKDENAEFFQWFYFLLTGAKNKACVLHIINAYDSTYSEKGWDGYQTVASYDRKEWFRVPTHYDGKKLMINHTPKQDCVYYAYFAPYSYERHQALIASAELSPYCKINTLCHTLGNHELNLLTIGQPEINKRKCWIIARQHAGETMAEWFCEGLITRLLDANDSLVRFLLANAVFYIVPNMNPDGSIRGNLRVNGSGLDLNRQWKAPDKNKAPETYYVHKKIQETGADFFLDVHGDENIPYVYVIGRRNKDTILKNRINQLEKKFSEVYKSANPDFQDTHGFPTDKQTNDILMNTASYIVGEAYDCLALTLEMPFKDNHNLQDKRFGWSSQRSMQLGYELLVPLASVLSQLR